MCRSEAESTAAGVASMFETDPVSGIVCTSSWRFRITGADRLVKGIGSFEEKGVGETSSWAMRVSLLGKFSFGLSRVMFGVCGLGGVSIWTFGRCPDHSSIAGTGVSLGSILSGSTSGSINVCCASLRCMK